MPTFAKWRDHLPSLTAFSFFGFISFLFGLAVLYVMYDILGVPYWIGVPFSVFAHLALHYALARSLVFTDSGRTIEEGFLIFVIIGILEIIFITGSVTLVVEYLSGDVYYTRIIAGVIAAILGFWANAAFTFRALK